MESVITHPDEMEHLEQYRVLGDYERKDSHQVNLYVGRIVHVIEKHDTGETMIVSILELLLYCCLLLCQAIKQSSFSDIKF